MSCQIMKGAPAAAALDEETIERVRKIKDQGIEPCLAILRVGEKENDLSYERGALKRCAKTGLMVRQVGLPETVSQKQLIAVIKELNEDENVHGILMFRPLPAHLDEKAACAALDSKKDVDGITAGSMAWVYSGSGEGYAPCTAQACMEILKYYGVEVCGKRVAVIGRSLVIGRPVAMLLMRANATVTICHTKTLDMPRIVKEADIVIVAAGKGESIGSEYFRAGQTVVDVGISWSEEKQKIVGDVCAEEAEQLVNGLTPVPGGVGAMTTAVLVSHVVDAASR